jgi:hypothetical protein
LESLLLEPLFCAQTFSEQIIEQISKPHNTDMTFLRTVFSFVEKGCEIWEIQFPRYRLRVYNS